jgi:hypothetical protein
MHCFDSGPCGTGVMALVNEWVMMRMMVINLACTRREEGEPGAGKWPAPVEKHQGVLPKDVTNQKAGFFHLSMLAKG